jgi:hypothetical protein
MNVTDYAVERLTTHHTTTEAGHLVEWVPLLRWITEQVADINGRGDGAGGRGIPLNDDALEVVLHIRARYLLMWAAVGDRAPSDMLTGTRAVWGRFKDGRAAGWVADQQWQLACDEFPKWVARILGMQDKERKRELLEPCPRCERRWHNDGQGQRVSAVVIAYTVSREPVAVCRACGARWEGLAEVARLGITVGSQPDPVVVAITGADSFTYV